MCEENKTIYEFNGCMWHGCLKCKSFSTYNTIKKSTYGYLNKQTQNRADYIKEAMLGYKFIEIWECEFDKNVEIKNFLKTNEIVSQLNPRDAFFGGHTNAYKLFHKCADDEKAYYEDICS